jgi:hypothetical protein
MVKHPRLKLFSRSQFPSRLDRDAGCVTRTKHQPAKRRRQLPYYAIVYNIEFVQLCRETALSWRAAWQLYHMGTIFGANPYLALLFVFRDLIRRSTHTSHLTLEAMTSLNEMSETEALDYKLDPRRVGS